IAYLRAREQVTSVYRESVRPIWLKREPQQRVSALCYMVDRGHPQYAGRLTLEQQLHHVRQGHGQSGANRDYVIATVGALEQLGYARPWIAAHRAPRPEQAGIKRDRKTRNSHLRIEPRHAILVAGLGAGRPAGAFRKDDDRAIARKLSPGARVHVRQGLRSPA